jgi:hypothetical protein
MPDFYDWLRWAQCIAPLQQYPFSGVKSANQPHLWGFGQSDGWFTARRQAKIAYFHRIS